MELLEAWIKLENCFNLKANIGLKKESALVEQSLRMLDEIDLDEFEEMICDIENGKYKIEPVLIYLKNLIDILKENTND